MGHVADEAATRCAGSPRPATPRSTWSAPARCCRRSTVERGTQVAGRAWHPAERAARRAASAVLAAAMPRGVRRGVRHRRARTTTPRRRSPPSRARRVRRRRRPCRAARHRLARRTSARPGRRRPARHARSGGRMSRLRRPRPGRQRGGPRTSWPPRRPRSIASPSAPAGSPSSSPGCASPCPTSADGDWPVSLELVDADDRSRWCTAADVAAAARRRPRQLGRRATRSRRRSAADGRRRRHDAGTALLPEVVDALVDPEPALDVEDAALVLERYDDVRAAGIEVLVPEQLARRRPQVRATARPQPARATGRFGAAAILDWQLVVDDADVDEADAAARRRAGHHACSRSAAGGSGSRAPTCAGPWRRSPSTASEHGEVSVARPAAPRRRAGRAGRRPRPSRRRRGRRRRPIALAGRPARRPARHSLADGDVPDEFAATLRPYQRRGLGLAAVPRAPRPRRLPGRRHGPRQDRRRCSPTSPGATGRTSCCARCRSCATGSRRRPASCRSPGCSCCTATTGRAATRCASAVAAADIVVTTYQSATRDIEALAAVAWTTVVLDEAQAVKNPHTHAAKAVRRLPAGQRIALTGTPVENRLGELWSILDVVTPGLLGIEAKFRDALRRADRAPPRRGGRPPRCAGSPPRSCCAAPRPTSRWCPTCPTRSSRSPGRR